MLASEDVLALDGPNVRAAWGALAGLGYRPRVPVTGEELADAATRRGWIESKGMTVLSFHSREMPATEVDVFVTEPLPFDEAWGRSLTAEIGDVTLRVAAIEDLIALKRAAGRPKDAGDIEALEEILAIQSGETADE